MEFTMPSTSTIRIALVLAASTALPAHAATDCDNAMTQQAMNSCAAAAYQREDARLNSLYKQLVALSDKSDSARLKQSQIAWLKFRDLHCDYEEKRYEGGSVAPLVKFTCLGNLTRQRNDTLQALTKDFH
jgi:uncharacterized protein YecT (DUF1311 family)